MKNIINNKVFLCHFEYKHINFSRIVGKWDLDVEMDKGILPSWLEVKKSEQALVGYFVAHNGSARPIS